MWDNGQRRATPYWSVEFVEDEKRSFPALKEEFLALLGKASQRRRSKRRPERS
jgi:hypothetical protein